MLRTRGPDACGLEHLTNLDRLPDLGAQLTALPAPRPRLGSFPVRAVVVLP